MSTSRRIDRSARPGRAGAFVLFFFLLLLPTAGTAQQGATLAGRAVDDRDSAPIGLATIVVVGAAGDTLSGVLAGEDGRFLVRGLTAGRYTIQASFPGYRPGAASVLVSELNQAYDLGEIRLERVVGVEEITVTAEAIRAAGVDTEVFRLDEGAGRTAGSMLDALKNLPGVTVDQEGKVSLRGSDKVSILIDGRQSSLTGFGSQRGLDNVPAANVEAVEIIYNPSARFDAAGMAGIINIIYKQERQQGLTAEVGLSMGLGRFDRSRPDLPTELGSFSSNPKIIPSLSLNYNSEKVRAFFQGDILSQDALPNNEFTTRFYDDGRVIDSQVPENREQTHYNARLGSDFLLGGGNTFRLSGIYDVEDHTDRAQVPFILESTGERERFWFWTEKEQTGFVNAAGNWKHEFATPGHELDVNLQFTQGWEDESYFLNEVSPIREGDDMTHIDAVENTLPLSIDYRRPLASGRLELGAKVQRRWLPVTYDVVRGNQSVIYQGLGDESDWDEDLYAAYGNLVRITDDYTLELGLRIEQTDVSYTIPEENIYYPGSDAYDYFELFPNARLSVALGDSYRLIAAYNRRIDRPGEPELRIFPKYDDPELLKVGNPFLRPQLTNVVELGLGRSWDGGSVQASGYYRDINDAFQRIYAIDDSNPNYDIVNKIYENVGHQTQTGVQVVAEQQVADPWRVSGSVNWFVTDIDAFQGTLFFPTERPFALAASNDDTWDLTLNNRIRMPKSGEVQLSWVYYARRNVPQGIEKPRSSLDLSAAWPLLNDRAEVQFTFTDILDDFAIEREIDGEGFTALYENRLETQVATLSLRYRF